MLNRRGLSKVHPRIPRTARRSRIGPSVLNRFDRTGSRSTSSSAQGGPPGRTCGRPDRYQQNPWLSRGREPPPSSARVVSYGGPAAGCIPAPGSREKATRGA